MGSSTAGGVTTLKKRGKVKSVLREGLLGGAWNGTSKFEKDRGEGSWGRKGSLLIELTRCAAYRSSPFMPIG